MDAMKLVSFRFSDEDLAQVDELVVFLRRRAESDGGWTPSRELTRTHAIKLGVANLLTEFRRFQQQVAADQAERAEKERKDGMIRRVKAKGRKKGK